MKELDKKMVHLRIYNFCFQLYHLHQKHPCLGLHMTIVTILRNGMTAVVPYIRTTTVQGCDNTVIWCPDYKKDIPIIVIRNIPIIATILVQL